MRYFKNAELTRLYNVSDKAVRNWIEGAQQGRLPLKLFEHNGRLYIADTINNAFLMEDLVVKGRKFRNRRNHKELTPTNTFYELYSSNQILDIINTLDKYREIPTHFRYFGKGAIYWDAYLHKLYDAGKNNMLVTTVELLRLDMNYFDHLSKEYNHINVVDVGVGNGLAAKEVLQHVHETGKLKKYIGIDSSLDLLTITEQNIADWFNGSVPVEKYARDINYERFTEALKADSYNKDGNSTINLILFCGGTLGNLREPDTALHVIRDSMGKNDILIYSDKLDTHVSRRFFDFNIEADKTALSLRNKFVLDLLSIDESFYEVEQFYDKQLEARVIQIRLKVGISIHFKIGSYQQTIEFQKGESILLFRAHEYTDQSIAETYKKNGFSQLRSTKSSNQEYILLTLKIEKGQDRIPPVHS